MNVAQAVQALKAEILAGVDAAEAVQFVAEDEGMNPALLIRKFTESYGKAPADFSAAPTAPLPTSTDKAKAAAEAWAARYSIPVGGRAMVGKPFTQDGERYLFVVVQGGCPQWGLKAIRVKDAARRQFSRATWNAILAQVAA